MKKITVYAIRNNEKQGKPYYYAGRDSRGTDWTRDPGRVNFYGSKSAADRERKELNVAEDFKGGSLTTQNVGEVEL